MSGHDMKTLGLDEIRIDGGTQPRVEINQDKVSKLVDDIANGDGDRIPLIHVFYDGTSYWLADGFHRYWAYRRSGREKIDVQIHHGELRDAQWFSFGANKNHGDNLSHGDISRALRRILADEKWSTTGQREIARHVGCGKSLVNEIAQSMHLSGTGQIPDRTEVKVTRGGKEYTMKTANIGRKKAERNEDEDVEIGNDFPAATKEPEEPKPIKKLGVGVERAYEAINILNSIPRNDRLRDRALQIVADWIKVNK